MDEIDLVIVGAGVIGLALAREAAQRGASVLCLDREPAPGMVTSSRNSEVIHAGIYYPQDSLKARLCVEGRHQLVAYLRKRNVPWAQPGKLIVATTEPEEAKLSETAARAEANGVTGPDALRPLTAREITTMEPQLSCRAALFSPSTGILDSHAYMQALQTDAEQAGAQFVFSTEISALEPGAPHVLRGVSHGDPFELQARRVILASGLDAAGLMTRAGLQDSLNGVQPYWLKGAYMVLNRPGPFRHLVYPVPSGGGLGVHVTLDLAGGTRFGPDTEAVSTQNYEVQATRIPAFEAAIRRYWPGLPDKALVPGYAGIRPKLRTPDGAEGDFTLLGPDQLGHAGLGALLGIESPGLTASLAVAKHMSDVMGL